MNGTQPPPVPTAKTKQSGMPTWAIVLVVLGVTGVFAIAVFGMLAAIAIPNFVKARQTAQMNACLNRLAQIEGAKLQWALENQKEMTDTPTQSEVEALLKDGQFPSCPAGGVYTIKAVDEPPTCSIPSHRQSAP